MPKYIEYVFAAYIIWIGVFAIYMLMLLRRSRRNRSALENLARKAGAADGSP